MMKPFIKVSGSSYPLVRKQQRLDFCEEILALKNELNQPLLVEDHGITAEIWRYFELEDVQKEYMKPLWRRAFVHPDIRKGAICAIVLVFLNVTPSGIFPAFSWFLILPVGTGFITFLYMLFGSIEDLIDSIKTFVSRFQMPEASTPKES
jgi:hypothetical protein